MERELLKQYWHPGLTLIAQQATIECPHCQLMKRPDPSLPNLQPIRPPPLLTRWAIDHTFFDGIPILVAIEYATGWIEADVVTSAGFEHARPSMEKICNTFGSPSEWISDNAQACTGKEAKQWHKDHGSVVKPTTPARPRGNGKVEQANGNIKSQMYCEALVNPTERPAILLQRALNTLRRTTRPSGYSTYFLMFGTQPPSHLAAHEVVEYTSEFTEEEEQQAERFLAQNHRAPLARSNANSLKASRAQIRAYLQEKKGLIRVFAPGDWVLRVRQRAAKHEPFYDGSWAIVSCHAGNTYHIRSPGGIPLQNKYNGTNLFPAYVYDSHPVRSLWYARKTMLQNDRKQLEKILLSDEDARVFMAHENTRNDH
ncbi:Uu.00g115860.m01.CDS01 [Anthostomella pinea]|uniref:Uu.00g115860.m01.CDS01 n=1 Tax=Anthostomella pinea TaxID=933095 RepID=A0AAI8VAQ6_9PEZI|nr:Uu.00g115860.m01.CDS01 [Anthostomella pinea]